MSTFNHARTLDLLCIGALNTLNWDVSLYLIFPEPKRKIQLEGPIVVDVLLARLWLLEARLVRVSSRARSTLCRASGILRAIII